MLACALEPAVDNDLLSRMVGSLPDSLTIRPPRPVRPQSNDGPCGVRSSLRLNIGSNHADQFTIPPIHQSLEVINHGEFISIGCDYHLFALSELRGVHACA